MILESETVVVQSRSVENFQSKYIFIQLLRIKEQIINFIRTMEAKIILEEDLYNYSVINSGNNYRMQKNKVCFGGQIDKHVSKVFDHKFEKTQVYREIESLISRNINTAHSRVLNKLLYYINLLARELKDHTTLAERYLLALEQLDNDEGSLLGKKNNISLDMVIPRIRAIRVGNSFGIMLAEDNFAREVLKDKLIDWDFAKKLYEGKNVKRCEVILAGGDATRFMRLPYLIIELYRKHNVLSTEILNKAANDPENNDIKHIINKEAVISLLNTPMFLSIEQEQPKNKLVDADIVHKVERVLDKFNPDYVPKALNYSLCLRFEEKKVFVSFFLITLIRTYTHLLREGTYGNKVIYVVRNRGIAKALQIVVDAMISIGILDEQKLKVSFISDIKNSIAIQADNSFFQIGERNELKNTSTGHGPVFIHVANELCAKNNGDNYFSVRTMDNVGCNIAEYTGVLQKALLIESGIRDNLVVALRTGNKDEICRLIGKENGIHDAVSIIEDIKSYVLKRWDFSVFILEKNSFLQVAEVLEELPLTVALVLANYQSVGGGLFVDADGHMSILDKYNVLNERNGIAKRFNPMVFASILKRSLDINIDNDLLYITQKNKKGVLIYQGESAATHIATNPKDVLKRIIDVSENLEDLFKEQKTIDQSNIDNTKSISSKVEEDIVFLQQLSGIKLLEIIDTINQSQEKAISSLKNKDIDKVKPVYAYEPLIVEVR